MTWGASLSMLPQDGAGGWTPRPRNDSAASIMMAVERLNVACTMIGASTLGRTARSMIRPRAASAIGLEHLPGDLRPRAAPRGRRSARLEDIERDHIARALKLHGGNRTRAAKDLGISRVTLLKKIEKFGLEGGDNRV